MERSELLRKVNSILQEAYGTPDLGNKKDPLDELIFISLCTRTGPRNVERAYTCLKRVFPSWKEVLDAPEGKVAGCVKVTGAPRKREKQIKEILKAVDSKAKSFDLKFLRKVNDEEVYKWLVSLPQVGHKVAHCVMLFSLGRNVLPVDTHLHRILRRLGVAEPDSSAEEVSREIQALVPRDGAYSLHVNLVVHGRRTCRAYSPKCDDCTIEALCAYAGHHVLESV